MNCTAAFQDMLAKVELPPRSGSPPRDMPPNMVSEYLIDNQVHLRLTYEGNSIYHGGSEPHDWSAAVVEQFMSRAKKGDGFDYGPSEASTVYQALAEYPVEHLSGLVVGSISPWVEAILLVAGQPWPSMRCAVPVVILRYLVVGRRNAFSVAVRRARRKELDDSRVQPHQFRPRADCGLDSETLCRAVACRQLPRG